MPSRISRFILTMNFSRQNISMIRRGSSATSKELPSGRIWILNARQMKCLALFPPLWNLRQNLYTKFPRIRRYPSSVREALQKLGIMRSTCEYFISRISEVETSDSFRISTCSKGIAWSEMGKDIAKEICKIFQV